MHLGVPAPAVALIETVEDARAYAPRDPANLAFVTQTTLSVDDTVAVVEALRAAAPGAPGIVSGAGHDAMLLAAAGVQAGMLFVRSLNGGVSHSPDELTSEQDIEAAVEALASALARIADR